MKKLTALLLTSACYSATSLAAPPQDADSLTAFLMQPQADSALAPVSYMHNDDLDALIESRLFDRMADRTGSIINTSMSFLGVPYRFGGNGVKDGGFDCSGLVRTVFEKAMGKNLPRRAAEQAAATRKISKDELQPGDLVFFNTMQRAFSHVGIYVGDNKFVHAPRTGTVVRVENMNNSYWTSRFNGARRVEAE